MPASSVAAALDRGALIVTPNKRLAREVVARHDEAQRAAGRTAWPAARAMPWHALVGELWQQALDAGLALPPHRLDVAQSAHLWQRIVVADLARDPLLDAAAATALAAEAWERVHAYGEGGGSWRGFAAGSPEVDAFVRWSRAFERETRVLAALDPVRAPDAIAEVAPSLPAVQALDVACVGFIELAPQQERLIAALLSAGARVERLDGIAPTEVVRGRLCAAPSARDELAAALAWARERAAVDTAARVAIVVHDLAERRALVQALAEDVLCPPLQWPGNEALPRPYDISAGGSLAEVPVVATALGLIALAHGAVDRAQAAVLLRSRHLPGDAALRSGIEREWIEQGRRSLTPGSLVRAVAPVDTALAARWRDAASRLSMPSRGSPRAFAEAWRGWLEATGWCEGVALDAAERAARGAWFELLGEFVRLTAVAPRMARDDALATLRDMAQARPFEPEAPGARVRILGVLEAAGLAFDAVWIAGLTAEAWPRAPEPNPLLPIDWQRQRDVPRATPARELAYARALTARLDACAPEVVFSYAEQVDDHPSLPSPLIAHLERWAHAPQQPRPSAHLAFDGRPRVLDCVADERLPAWPEGEPFRGGAALVEQQSACPFQAAARHRLRAERWPVALSGLPPPERGVFMHAALAAFWREVRDQATLLSLDEAALDARIAQAVVAGRAAVEQAVWDALPGVVAAVEGDHVAQTMKRWLLDVERERPSFRVEDTEVAAALTLSGHPLQLRVDRIDRLADGRRAIVDYKTGLAVGAKHWFGERPQAPQLALYAMAVGVGDVAALAYAQLKAGEVKAVGLADRDALWPGLAAPAMLKGVAAADWGGAKAELRDALSALARAAHEGDARILPREPKVCTRCDFGALCRIAAVDEGEEDKGTEEGEA